MEEVFDAFCAVRRAENDPGIGRAKRNVFAGVGASSLIAGGASQDDAAQRRDERLHDLLLRSPRKDQRQEAHPLPGYGMIRAFTS